MMKTNLIFGLLVINALSLCVSRAHAQTLGEIFSDENVSNIACYPEVNGKAVFPYTLWNEDNVKIEGIPEDQIASTGNEKIAHVESYSAKTDVLKIQFVDMNTNKVLSSNEVKLKPGEKTKATWSSSHIQIKVICVRKRSQ